MWTELSLAWQMSIVQAWEASCAGTIPIGAVVVGPGGALLAVGRNRVFAPREPAAMYLSGVRLAHAEVNALLALEASGALDEGKVNPRECALYTTTEPCPLCVGAILMANVRRVYFASRDPWAGSTGLYRNGGYIGSKNIVVDGPPNPVLEDILVALQVEYFLREGPRRGLPSGPGRAHPIFERLALASPWGSALGRRLYQSGLLEQLRAAGCPPGETIDRLAECLALGTFLTIAPSDV
jgi:tRNA(adenine34) deaminase